MPHMSWARIYFLCFSVRNFKSFVFSGLFVNRTRDWDRSIRSIDKD